MLKSITFQDILWKLSMIMAPLLISIAQFFWQEGLVGSIAGCMQVLAFTFWIVAFKGLFDHLQETPVYSTLGFLVAAYACVGGAGFGLDGIYSEAMGLANIEEADVFIQKAFEQNLGLPLVVSLFFPGILFPLSLLTVGIQLIRSKKIAVWIGVLLIIAAVGFPLSRIPRIDIIAHIDNLLLLVSHALIAFKLETKLNINRN